VTPQQILASARQLLDRPDSRTSSVWPRAAALLARQAFELGLDDHWRSRGIALDRLATRPQLICLPSYLSNRDLAARATHAWSALSRACHHHPYDLAPSVGELRIWLEAVDDALAAMTASAASGPAAQTCGGAAGA
jgi:hypothetical protein